ncbi:MAG TPA: endonuclease domain-containing protein [Streptosporangiaceae bacterium]
MCRSDEWSAPGKNNNGRPHADHDPVNGQRGEFRGILCGRCNIGMGQFDHDPARLRAAADYLERALASVT